MRIWDRSSATAFPAAGAAFLAPFFGQEVRSPASKAIDFKGWLESIGEAIDFKGDRLQRR